LVPHLIRLLPPGGKKQIGNSTPRPIAVSSDGGSNVGSSKEQITPPNVMSKYLVQYIPAPQERKKLQKQELLDHEYLQVLRE